MKRNRSSMAWSTAEAMFSDSSVIDGTTTIVWGSRVRVAIDFQRGTSFACSWP
jgi:hypothetical protein